MGQGKVPLWNLIFVGICLLLFAASELLGGLFSSHWFLDLTLHFRWHRFAYAAFFVGWLLYLRSRKLALAWGLLAAFSAVFLFAVDNLEGTPAAGKVPANVLQVISFNVLSENTRREEAVKWIEAGLKPGTGNIVFLMEITADWEKALAPLKKKLPHSFVVPREDNFGIALFSDLPLEGAKATFFDEYLVPAAEALVTVNGKKIRVLGVHPVPPVGEDAFTARNLYLSNLRKNIDAGTEPTLVLGDLNCTPFSRNFTRLLAAEGPRPLRQTDVSFFKVPTWYGAGPLFPAPIDYILHTRELSRLAFKAGPDLGSDHRPLVVRLELAE